MLPINLSGALKLGRHINTICMPKQEDVHRLVSLDNCYATGWGQDKFGFEGDLSFLHRRLMGK